MRMPFLFRGGAAGSLVCMVGFMLVGCGAKDATNPPLSSKTRPQPKNPVIQAEIDRIQSLPRERDAMKRPLLLSQRAENRRAWFLRALEQGYDSSGHADQRWNSAVHSALEAYADYTRVQAIDRYYGVLTNAIAKSTAAGCDDPMLLYLYARYAVADARKGDTPVALAYLKAHRALVQSRYHPLFKFFAAHRAALSSRQADPTGNRSALLEFGTIALEDLARDTNAPAAEVFEPAFSWVQYGHDKNWLDLMFPEVGAVIEKYWQNEEAYSRLLALVEITQAWNKRGRGFANTVADQGWEAFRVHLDQAEKHLNRAWQMDSNNAYTAYLMMRLEQGQGRGYERMEHWFERAMALSTNYYDAAILMSFYLEPRWYGSDQQALKFARSCVSATNWGGSVPLVLPELHRSLARYYNQAESPAYWHRPEVWNDVRSAYEKFFQLSPDAVDWRHNYARDAYLCGHYAEFLSQAKLFTQGTNFEYFGGEAKFRQMMARAVRSVAKAGPTRQQ